MSKSTIEDISNRKPATFVHARNYVDPNKEKSVATAPREPLSHEEALKREILVNLVLMDLLISKGVISREELTERIEEIRKAR